MKVLLASKERTYQTRTLQASSRVGNHTISLRQINKENVNKINIENFDFVFWRSGSLTRNEKQKFFYSMSPSKLINLGYRTHPLVPQKYYQQLVAAGAGIKGIETFTFRNKKELLQAIDQEAITLPLICKPNLGAKGEGVHLIKTKSEINSSKGLIYKELVFQEYIENDGDYRVFVIGGVPVAYMKRTAVGGGFLNNISQGGDAQMVSSPALRKELGNRASSVACLFDLNICGVDFIVNKNNNQIYFMEVNTVPQWEGIQGITTFSISDKIVEYLDRLGTRGDLNRAKAVKDYYDSNVDFLNDKKFHYLSRMYLWTGKSRYLKQLKKIEQDYIGLNNTDQEKRLRMILEADKGRKAVKNKEEREAFYKKYPNLNRYNAILFKWLFSKNVYNKDLRPIIKNLIPDEDLLKLRDGLLKDNEALLVLSTHAINFLYNLREYLNKERDSGFINIDKLFRAAIKGYKKYDNKLLELYFYTHCIIGESRFYKRRVTRDRAIYRKMLLKCESIIRENYFSIALDNKLEFLVACKLVGYQPVALEGVINSEASYSMSTIGNFIVDTHNQNFLKGKRNGFARSEHRNVLYIMSQSDFVGTK